MDCELCETTCTDLLVMMSVLQETHHCFEYVSERGIDGNVKVTFGGYEFLSNDFNIRTMLVTDLVQAACSVLDAVDRLKESALKRLASPDVPARVCYSARANIAFLDTTMTDFREALTRITDKMSRCQERNQKTP